MDGNTPSERDVRHEIHKQEQTADTTRDVADWIEAIGPEDADLDDVMDNLEQYGFDKFDDDEKLSVPSATPTPSWDLETAASNIHDVEELPSTIEDNTGGSFRPVEDKVIEELDDEAPDDPALV
jgi:hypothetical protein